MQNLVSNFELQTPNYFPPLANRIPPLAKRGLRAGAVVPTFVSPNNKH